MLRNVTRVSQSMLRRAMFGTRRLSSLSAANTASASLVRRTATVGSSIRVATGNNSLKRSVPVRFMASYPEHTKLAMPALSPTMEKGTLAKWYKKEGDAIKAGDIIADVETDKATVAFEATEPGIVAKVLVPAGKEVPLGAIVAILVDEPASVAAFKDFTIDV